MGSYHLTSIEFQLEKIKKFWRWSVVTNQLYIYVNEFKATGLHTKNGLNVNFYVRYILLLIKKNFRPKKKKKKELPLVYSLSLHQQSLTLHTRKSVSSAL